MTKIKHKDRILKAAIEKQQLTYKGHVYNSHKADFSAQREDIREEIAKYSTIHFKRWKRKKKIYNKEWLYPVSLSFRFDGKIKSFIDKQKL